MLDSFFGSLSEDGDWQRLVSDRGFAKARDRLAWGALERLNTFVVERADALGLVARWRGLRVVATDASVLMPSGAAVFAAQALGQSRSAPVYLVFAGHRAHPACQCPRLGVTRPPGWWPI
jgi:hypothetical protein